MPTINIKTQLSENDLLSAVKQLTPEELENFIQKMLALQGKQSQENNFLTAIAGLGESDEIDLSEKDAVLPEVSYLISSRLGHLKQ
jgi:hypothetical protein